MGWGRVGRYSYYQNQPIFQNKYDYSTQILIGIKKVLPGCGGRERREWSPPAKQRGNAWR